MRIRVPTLLALVLFASVGLQAADRMGIGLSWGVGYETFDDSRLIGASQIVNINFEAKDLLLFVHTEQQAVAFDDGGTTEDFGIRYQGIGLNFKPNKHVTAGIGIGKGDIRFSGATPFEQSAMYAELLFGLDLLSNDGDKLKTRVGIDLKYRYLGVDDFPIDIQNLNGMQLEIIIGLIF